MRLEQLEYILKTAEAGSISAAALELNISQPSLSAAISSLEKEYNIQIFHRSRLGVQITDRGAHFLRQIRKVYDSAQDLRSFADSDISGLLRIASVPGINSSILPNTVFEFIKKYPLTRLELEEGGSHAVKKTIDNNHASVGLCSTRNITELDNGNYVYHYLLSAKVMACVPPDSPLAKNKEVSLPMLIGYPLVIFNRSFRVYTHIISLLEQIGDPNIIFTTSDPDLAKKMIIQCSAVGFFSNVLLTNDHYIKNGILIPIPIIGETGTEFITLQKKEQVNNPLAKRFIHEIRRQAKIFSELNNFIGK